MSKMRRFFILLLLIVVWIYVGWRTIYTLPSGIALIPGLLLLIAEVILAVQNTLFYILLYKPKKRETPPLPNQPFTIDIFITTYNESLALVKRTILACKNLDYPEGYVSIWVCDDGRRAEMKEMARSLGVGYLSRNSNEHAKAGNLNNALRQTKSEFIVTIDADMIPKPNFFKNTIGYFLDDLVAFVQMPQSFYNEDVYQYNLKQSKNIPNEQDLFMRLIQTGRDRFNSTIYIGSNTIFRRKALEAVDGFATGTITEDMATGMLIQSKGYKTVFHNEVLAQGLAAESLSDFLNQRIRWARGTIQTMRKWNPITLPGLTIMQRLLYMSSLVYWYFGIFKLIFILAPIVYLIFGLPALKASLTGILLFWLPYFLLTSIVENVLLEKRMKRFWSNIYETSVAPFLASAVLLETFTKRRIPFKVTPKGVTSKKTSVNVTFAAPHLLLFGLSLAALIMGGFKLVSGEKEGVLINLFWLLYNLCIIVPTILLARERPKLRKAERFKRDFQVELFSKKQKDNPIVIATTIDVSETGCSLFFNRLVEIPDQIEISIHGMYSTFHLQGSLVYYDSHKEGYQIAIRFNEMEDSILQLWIKEIYGEIPDESLFQYKTKTDMGNVLMKYFREFPLPLREKVRTSPRISTSLKCQVMVLPEATLLAIQEGAATVDGNHSLLNMWNHTSNHTTISDLSFHGCQILLEGIELSKEDVIGVHIPELNFFCPGSVVRKHDNQDQTVIGVKWLTNSGKQLVEAIGETKIYSA